jgi:hypothetical protein
MLLAMTPGAPPPYGPYSPPQPQQGYGPQPGYPQPYAGGPPPFHPGQPRNDDASHLSALSICTFVYAGIVAMMSLLGAVYVAMGIFMATSMPPGPSGGPSAAAMGGFFAVFGGLFMLVGLAIAVALVFSGLGLRKRQRRNLSFVVACIICLNIPFGTLLGVFTLIVLSRASVKALYDQRAYETA